MDHHLLAYYIGIAIILYTHLTMLSIPQIMDSKMNPSQLPADQVHALANILAVVMLYYYKNGAPVSTYYIALAILIYTHYSIMNVSPLANQHAKYNLVATALIAYWFMYINNIISW